MLTTLQTTPIFRQLAPSDLVRLEAVAMRHTLGQGEYLFYQDSPARRFYLVEHGRIRIVQHTLDGKDVTMGTFVDGDIMGLIVALVNEPFPGSAEAIEDSTCISLPTDIMWELMADNAQLSVRIVKMVAGRLLEAHQRIRELSVERVQRRIARSLLRLVDKVGVTLESGAIHLDMRLSRQDIAQMNGTTLETVSRTLAQWEREGIISAAREQVTILQMQFLEQVAEDWVVI